jgi:hypothetical protein
LKILRRRWGENMMKKHREKFSRTKLKIGFGPPSRNNGRNTGTWRAGKVAATLALVMAAMAILSPTPVLATVQIEGVRFEREVAVNETRLALNGYGLLRYMVFIKAYVGALYLPQASPERDIFAPIPKQLVLEYFHAIKKEDFAKATRQKILDNISPDQLSELQPSIDRLADMYRDVQPGDRYTLTYIPGSGTELALNGASLGIIPGEAFSRAVFAIWLGQNPIDKGFRDRLLGVS